MKNVSPSKDRTVGEQVAHIHNVRLMWLKQAAPEIFATQTKIEKEQANDKELLCDSLENSGKAIKKLFEQANCKRRQGQRL